MSAGLDFETKILVKEDAPELLRKELNAKGWEPKTIAISGVTDPYQPIERKLEITRRVLEVLADFRNPVAIITKNHLVTRDIDHLSELARFNAARVFVSITTLDPKLAGVMVAPVVPAITDSEMPAILKAAREAGAKWAGFVVLRLPWAVAPLFERWLDEHYPDRKERVLGRVRDLRGGKLYDAKWGVRGRGEGIFAEQLAAIFEITCRRLGLNEEEREMSISSFRRRTAQSTLF
ncbi:MAG: hypothetical protein ABIO78_04450 [Thermoanaerobaculia bacterium]